MAKVATNLHIGESYITISDGEKRKNGYWAHSLALKENTVNVYTSDDSKAVESTAVLIQQLLKDANIKKKEVNVVISDSHSYSQIIEMPMLTEKELFSLIRYQADQFIPIPIDKVSLDIEVLYENKQTKKTALLLVACSSSVLDRVTTAVEIAGLVPSAVENEASAIFRLMSDIDSMKKAQPAPSAATLLINFGCSSTSLYLYNQAAGVPLQIHNFALGYNIFIKDIKANYNMVDKSARELLDTIGFSSQQSSYNLASVLSSPYALFVSEIERFILSVKGKFNIQIAAVFFFGEGNRIASLDKKLSASLGTAISIFTLSDYFIKNNTVDFFKNNLFLFAPAVGASLRQ